MRLASKIIAVGVFWTVAAGSQGLTRIRDGVDTVYITLHSATTNPHQVWVRLTGKNGASLEAASAQFSLAPGDVDAFRLETSDGRAVPADTSIEAPGGALYMRAVGRDRYGNLIGPVEATWTADGTLHAVDAGPASYLYYTTGATVYNENGCITATAGGTSYRMCVHVRVPPAAFAAVVTRDTSGDGRLDRVEIHLTRPVSVAGFADSPATNNVAVMCRTRTSTYPLPLTDIAPRTPGTTLDSVFYLELSGDVALPQYVLPQTAWTPTVTIDGFQDITSVEHASTDGAGPVIWRVTKTVHDICDHSTDVVTVMFSEDLANPPGAASTPDSVFQVWRLDDNGNWVRDDSILAGIVCFGKVMDLHTVQFTMSNNRNLTSKEYFAIRSGVVPAIADNASMNAPNVNNQRVPVSAPDDPAPSLPDPPRSHGCGAGVGLALVPPICLRLRPRRRRSARQIRVG